jgi:tRNA threonylcarbamoyladenosine modification (KEOPS) complex  Pcc1 subunit
VARYNFVGLHWEFGIVESVIIKLHPVRTKSVSRDFKTAITFSFDPKRPKSSSIARSVCSSLKSETQFTSKLATKSKISARNSELIIKIAATNMADFRACVNSYLRLVNMAYQSILD